MAEISNLPFDAIYPICSRFSEIRVKTYAPSLAWTTLVACHMAATTVQASMVDFTAFGTLFLLSRRVLVRLAIVCSIKMMLLGRSGIRRSGIGVGRIVREARHGTKSGVVGGTRQSHPTLCLLYVSVILLSVLVI